MCIRDRDMITPDFQPTTLLEKLYTGFNKDYLSIPAEPEQHFFRSQKIVYDRLEAVSYTHLDVYKRQGKECRSLYRCRLF